MTQKIKALAKLARLSSNYAEENPFAMRPRREREWEDAIEQAMEDAQKAGASDTETDEASDWVTDRASQFLHRLHQQERQA